jgi:hypothetical protein
MSTARMMEIIKSIASDEFSTREDATRKIIELAKDEGHEAHKEGKYFYVVDIEFEICDVKSGFKIKVNTKDNKYLEELIEGGIPVEITDGCFAAQYARDIIHGECCYKDFDFGGQVYDNNNGVYVIIWD